MWRLWQCGLVFLSVVLVSCSTCDVINNGLPRVTPFQFLKAQYRCSRSRNLAWGPEFSPPASEPVEHLACAWVMAGGTWFP